MLSDAKLFPPKRKTPTKRHQFSTGLHEGDSLRFAAESGSAGTGVVLIVRPFGGQCGLVCLSTG